MTIPVFNTVKDLISFLKEKLATIYEFAEAENLSFMLANHLYGISKTDYVMEKAMGQYDQNALQKTLDRLLAHEPIQHIIGECEFYGLRIKVTPEVLIPRPETEEIVDRIIQHYKGQKNLKIIDYCTGSGCIAIALAKQLAAEVVAVDVSEKALEVAKENARVNDVAIRFIQVDVLAINSSLLAINYDLIVSNPPYVLESEKVKMNKNVLDHDPHLALFVADEQALIFYERITQLAAQQLKKGGRLYFEINEQFGEETKAVMQKQGFSEVEVLKDFQRKDRMVVGVI